MLDRCRVPYGVESVAATETVAGVDVGRVLHVVIRDAPARPIYSAPVPLRPVPEYMIDRDTGRPPRGAYPEYWPEPRPATPAQPSAPGRLRYAGELDSFEELAALCAQYRVRICVVDSAPETRSVVQFARRMRGSTTTVLMARYDRSDSAIERATEGDVGCLHCDRTYVLDMMLESFRDGSAQLPLDARQLGGRGRKGFGEYYRQLQAPKRVIEKDARGISVARWINSADDHYAHNSSRLRQRVLCPHRIPL